ncbi:hypothetical protein [Bacteriovorax sp. Seq25_V]|uniref:hypothetical protein n=1 Tax=Bacteriovorax sp. Seq25_V TaxID=1201288 RepID=UPI000389DEE1|nr:hypothetical protein [Bacteriovorax sp. Seq25_V]EQC46036.1 hypothetical protein M900_1834 [Bacteriovorax sp. Seq25_V]
MIIYNIIFALIISFTSYAQNEEHKHDHDQEKIQVKQKQAKEKKHDKHDDHNNHDDHDDNDEHDDHDKKGANDAHDDHDDHDKKGAHDDHEHEDKTGKNKAIQDVSEEKGFKLSNEAISSLKIELKTVTSKNIEISKSSLVQTKDKEGVYIYRNGYFKFHLIEAKEAHENKINIKIKNFQFGDQIVIKGIELLRVSDVFSTDKANYGHSH